MNLFRSLLPHWNFFDRIIQTYGVEYRLKNSHSWQTLSFDQKRCSYSLNVNADLNLALANVSLLAHLAREIDEANPDNFKKLTTFKMIQEIVKSEAGPTVSHFRLINNQTILFETEIV